MDTLDGFLETTGNNDLDVIMVDDQDLDGVIEELGRTSRNDPRRKKFYRTIKKGKYIQKRELATRELTAKAEFEKRLFMLPKHIIRDLQNGKKQIVEGDLYAIKAASQVTNLECFANADDKTVGATNLGARKLDAGQYFLVTGIRLQYGSGTTPSAIDFSTLDLPAVVKNGEFKLELGSKVLIPEVSVEKFNTEGRADVQKGYWKLENPKMLEPLTEINAELKFPTATAANGAIKIELVGATIGKA